MENTQEPNTQEPNIQEPNNTQDTTSDEAITKAIADAKKEWEKEHQQAIENAKAEGERLAKLSEKERKAEDIKNFEKEKAEFEKEKLTLFAKTELAKAKISTDIAEYIAKDTNENITAIVDVLKKAVDEAVQEEVTERLKGKTPPLGGVKNEPKGGFMDIIRENQR